MIIIKLQLSVLPVCLIGLFLYLKDFEKEPIKQLLKIFFIEILLPLFVLLPLYYLMEYIFPDTKVLESYSIFTMILYYFVVVGFAEEITKLIPAWFFGIRTKFNSSFYDCILFCAVSALGFACIENIGYVLENNISTAIVRMFLSVPGHILYGCTMGIFLGLVRVNKIKNEKGKAFLCFVFALLIPTILHGLFNFLLNIGGLLPGIYISLLYLLGVYEINIIHRSGKNNSYLLEENLFKIDSFEYPIKVLRFISLAMIIVGCIEPFISIFPYISMVEGIILVLTQIISYLFWSMKNKIISIIFSVIGQLSFVVSGISLFKNVPGLGFYLILFGLIFQIICNVYYIKSSKQR